MGFGLFGKLPQKRDFITVGLPAIVLHPFETWLQQAVAASRSEIGRGWEDYYLVAPIWRFWFGQEIFGTVCAGALMPSVDQVGRYFPLAIIYIADQNEPFAPPLLSPLDDWYRAIEERLLSVLSQDDRADVGNLLAGLPAPRQVEEAEATAAAARAARAAEARPPPPPVPAARIAATMPPLDLPPRSDEPKPPPVRPAADPFAVLGAAPAATGTAGTGAPIAKTTPAPPDGPAKPAPPAAQIAATAAPAAGMPVSGPPAAGAALPATGTSHAPAATTNGGPALRAATSPPQPPGAGTVLPAAAPPVTGGGQQVSAADTIAPLPPASPAISWDLPESGTAKPPEAPIALPASAPGATMAWDDPSQPTANANPAAVEGGNPGSAPSAEGDVAWDEPVSPGAPPSTAANSGAPATTKAADADKPPSISDPPTSSMPPSPSAPPPASTPPDASAPPSVSMPPGASASPWDSAAPSGSVAPPSSRVRAMQFKGAMLAAVEGGSVASSLEELRALDYRYATAGRSYWWCTAPGGSSGLIHASRGLPDPYFFSRMLMWEAAGK